MSLKIARISLPLVLLLAVIVSTGIAFAQQFPGAIDTTTRTGVVVTRTSTGWPQMCTLVEVPEREFGRSAEWHVLFPDH